MNNNIYNFKKIEKEEDLLKIIKSYEGKPIKELNQEIKNIDNKSKLRTKSAVGYVVENFLGVDKNSSSKPDLKNLNIEIKSCALKYNKDKRLNVKEPVSLNIINYCEEYKKDIKESSLYKKNKKIIFWCYVHDKNVKRSEYLIKYIFLWEMDDKVLNEIEPDYKKIIEYIKSGNAHNIHQGQHKYLTLCPKHSGKFKDPNCRKSKRNQPFSNKKAEVRAYRFKNKYMNIIITRELNKKLEKNSWVDD